jgi:hypothetical protein
MKRVAGCFVCFFLAGLLHAQHTVSASQPITRVDEQTALYNLTMFSDQIWEEQFAGGPMRMFNPLTYEGHNHVPKFDTRYPAQTRKASNPIYFFGSWSVLLILGLLIARNRELLKTLIQSAVNFRLSVQFARQSVAATSRATLLFVLCYHVLLALFIEYASESTFLAAYELKSPTVFGLLTIFISLIYLIKYGLYSVVGVLLKFSEAVSYYLSMVFLINSLLGILLLFFVSFVFFSDPFISNIAIYIIIFIISIGLIWRYFMAIRFTGKIVSAHVFHFILYFCAVELIPTAVIAKFLLNV